MSAVDELIELLLQSGARPTLDPGRNCSAACIGCGGAGPNELVHVGQYVTGTQGGMRPRDWHTRPLCRACQLAFFNDTGQVLRTTGDWPG